MCISSVTLSRFFFNISKSTTSFSNLSVDNITTCELVFLNSCDTTYSASTVSTANDTNVGGTSISLNVPDILSFPPIAGIPSLFWA